jgi:molecular chaperone HtpG
VIDSPDIPLNVSRSYLQADGNVKKISGHITKKVADRLNDIFKSDRKQFEEKWDDVKLFIQYGMLSDEKFYERAEKFALLKNIDGKYFTFDEYKDLVKGEQKDKNGDLIYLYANEKDAQYTYIEAAKAKGYDVLLMDGQLDVHVISQLEQKFEKTRFVRVDGDVVDKLIEKENAQKVNLTDIQRNAIISIFSSQLPEIEKTNFVVTLEQLSADSNPVFITQNEFMRRMKDMSAMQGGGGMMSFYGEMPDSYNLVVNTGHPLIEKLLKEEESATEAEITPLKAQYSELNSKVEALKAAHKDKKDEEIPTAEKEELDELHKKLDEISEKEKAVYKAYGDENKQVSQLIDLALLAHNMLKGEPLAKFVKRSVELM